jgi:hypothetical protein
MGPRFLWRESSRPERHTARAAIRTTICSGQGVYPRAGDRGIDQGIQAEDLQFDGSPATWYGGAADHADHEPVAGHTMGGCVEKCADDAGDGTGESPLVPIDPRYCSNECSSPPHRPDGLGDYMCEICDGVDTLSHRITECGEGPVTWRWTRARIAAILRMDQAHIPDAPRFPPLASAAP